MTDLDRCETMFQEVQDHICTFMAEADGNPYREDNWDYHKGNGGGRTRIWEESTLLEKGGVNYSSIRGESLPESAATAFKLPEGTGFSAMGVSLVIHPWNPYIPTIHANIRHFCAGDRWWFGGGIDLTPYYPVKEEIIAFHRGLKAVCDRHGEPYAEHKKTCDDYFTIQHRNQMRGVGGIFFDHMHTDSDRNFAFVRDVGMSFNDLYRPFIVNHRDDDFGEREREFQLHRRARYAEFNLVYDRGTKFGLQSKGRIESILMSMPLTAKWRYDWHPEPGTPEYELETFYLQPQDWVNMTS